MPKKDTTEYRLYMKNYMSKKRSESSKASHTICFHHQLKHFIGYRKVLRDLLDKCYFLEWINNYDNVMNQLEFLYPAYYAHKLKKGMYIEGINKD
jgi:hypothetical protein